MCESPVTAVEDAYRLVSSIAVPLSTVVPRLLDTRLGVVDQKSRPPKSLAAVAISFSPSS